MPLTGVLLFLNGAFGVGKTTTARALTKLLPGARLVDPEHPGLALQRLGLVRGDFRRSARWERAVVAQLRVARALCRGPLIAPMAFDDPVSFSSIVERASAFDRVERVCLRASWPVIEVRLEERGFADGGARSWAHEHSQACVRAYADDTDHVFGTPIDTEGRTPEDVAHEVIAAIDM